MDRPANGLGLRNGRSLVRRYVDKLHFDRANLLDVLANYASKRSRVVAKKEFLDIASPQWRSDVELVAAIEAAAKRIG